MNKDHQCVVCILHDPHTNKPRNSMLTYNLPQYNSLFLGHKTDKRPMPKVPQTDLWKLWKFPSYPMAVGWNTCVIW